MADQEPLTQTAPVVSADLSTNSGLIDNRPLQAPLPPTNSGPLFTGVGADQAPKTIAQLFNSMKTPADEQSYLNPDYTPQPLTKRYANWNPYIDNEEVAAKQQPWYDKWANALVKTGATAVGTLAQSLMTIPDTINAIRSGNFSKEYQSDFENSVDNWSKNLEDQFPNYYSKWEQEHPFLSAIPFSGGGANFWSDKLIKNLGFTIGAIGGAVLQDTVVGAMTEGVGDIPLVGNQIGKAALWLNKMFSTETKLGEALGATRPGLLTQLTETAEAVPASKQAMFDLNKLAQVAASKKITDAGRYAMNLYGAARTEAGFEARDGFNTVKADLTKQFQLTNQRDPTPEEITEIEKYATASGNVRFGVNMALLTVSDAIQFDNILKPFNAAQNGITGSLQKAIENKGAALALKEGTVDTFEKKVGATTVKGKVWNLIKPQIPNILSEGIYEEGGQFAAQMATQNYYERKYFHDKGIATAANGDKEAWSPSSILNIMHSTGQGLAAEFGTTEGLENILLGSLTAILTGGVEHWYDKRKGISEAQTQATLTLLNNNSVTGLMQNMFGNATKSASSAQNMQKAAESGDLFTYKNNQSQLFTNFVLAHLQGDRFDVAIEKLKIAKDLPQDEFEKAFGMDKTSESKSSVSSYIDGLIEKADSIKNNYDVINQVFTNPYTFNKKAKEKDDIVENEKHVKFEEWKASLLEHTSDIDDTNRRLSSLANKTSNVNSSISLSLIQNLTHPDNINDLKKEYAERAAELQKSLDDKLVPSKDRKQQTTLVKAFNERITDIDEFFNASEDERNDKFLKMFDNLLHFEINNQDLTTKGLIEIKKQNLPNLIRDGVDANRLQARKTIANKAYDILTSEKGFDKYFSRLEQLQRTSASIAEDMPLEPVDINADDLKIPIKTKDGKEIAFAKGQSYTLNIGTKKNPQIADLIYQGIADNGDLIFTDSTGKEITLSPNKIATLDDEIKQTADSFKQEITKLGSGDPVNSTETPQDEDKKKDLTKGPRSTTDPRFEETTPFNNFHKRHQEFLFNLGSTDSNLMKQDIKSKLKIMPVTAATAIELGFPKEFAQNITGQEDTIRLVYITEDSQGRPALIDKNGITVATLGVSNNSEIDLNDIIFSTLTDSSLQYQGQDRYTNKSNLDPAKVQQWQKEFRSTLLSKDATNMPLFNFSVSRGIANVKNQNARNSVVDVKLVTVKDLNKLVITIPTQGDVTIAALLNNDGEGIASDTTGVNMPLGIPLLNHGGNLVYLNNRHLTPVEAKNAYDLIVEMANRAASKGGLDNTILKYLSRILYFSNPKESKAISPNQIWIDNTGIHFGPSLTTPFFTDTLKRDASKILDFLQNSYHGINNYELNRATKENIKDIEFNELTMKDGKLAISFNWPTYSHYLLMSPNPPLATNIAKPQGDEIPIVQKYSVLQVNTFNNKAFELSEPQPKPSIPAIPGIVTKTETKKAVPAETAKLVAQITENQKKVKGKSEDEQFYIIDGEQYRRVTSVIPNDFDGDTTKYENSRTAGSNVDGIVRRFFDTQDIIKPEGISQEAFDHIITTLSGIKKVIEARGETFITNNIVLYDTVSKIAGEVDILSVDKDGNFNIYDIKTGKDFSKYDTSFDGKLTKRENHTNQLSAYSNLFTNQYGVTPKNLGILPFQISYDANGTISTAEKQKGITLKYNPDISDVIPLHTPQSSPNEVEQLYDQPDGRKIKYAQIFNKQGELTGIRVIGGVSADGKDVQIPADRIPAITKFLSEGLGLITETPQTTQPIQTKNQTGSNHPDVIKLRTAKTKEEANQAIKEVTQENNLSKAYKDAGNITDDGYHFVSKFNQDWKLQTEKLAAAIEKITTPAPAPSALDKLKAQKGKPKDTQYRAANVIPGSYVKGDISKEIGLMRSILPGFVQFEQLDHLIHMTGGGQAWGAMQNAGIYIYKNAEIGTTYHEAFELVWQNFLNGGEQLNLYKEFAGRTGSFVTWEGIHKTYSTANFKEAKEQIAEEFRDYVLGNENKIGEKQKSWFDKLIDFIKKIFLGSQQSINSLFKNIGEGYYKNYPASQKNIGAIEYRNIKASEAFIQDVLQGMTADLFSREFEKDSAIVTQLEENPKQATTLIYGRLFNSMQYFFTSDDSNASDTLQTIYGDKVNNAQNEAEAEQVAQEFEGLQKHWEFIKNNWQEFVNEHMKYLKVFKVEFSVDDSGEIVMDSTSRRELEDYEKMTGQSEYARDIMTMNARNSASEKVKLMFATIADREFIKSTVSQTLSTLGQGEVVKTRIKREDSQVKLPKLASYAKTFNYVLHNVTNINGIYDIYKKLVNMSNDTRIKSNAIVDALVNRLKFKDGFKSKSIDQAKLILSTENALAKQKPDFVRQFVDDSGNVYFKTSIVNSKVDQIVDNWIANIKDSDAVKVTSDSNFIFNKSVRDIKEPLKFLETIGINIDFLDYSILDPATKTKFDNEVNQIRSLIESNVGKKLPIFTTKQLGIDSRLNNLAGIYVDRIVGDDTDSMHFNLDGELTSNFVLPNFISTIQSDANNSKTRQEFIAKNPQFNDIFHRDSILLNDILYGEDGKFISPVNIAVVEGRESSDSNNKATSSLTEAERYILEINNNLQGVYYTLLPADAKTEWAIYTGTYIKASEYFDETTRGNSAQKFTDRMWGNLQTEVALAQDYTTNPNRKNIAELGKKVDGRTKGSSLRFFKDILTSDMVTALHTSIDANEPISIDRAEFDKVIIDWVNSKSLASFNYLNNNKIFSLSNQGNYKLNGLLTDFVSKYVGPKKTYFTKEEATNLLTFREMNYAINNIEMHKFFFGDPAQYNDELKRIKSFLSGREWSHVDYVGTAEGFNQWANGVFNRVGTTELQEGDPGYHVFSNQLATLTANDIYVESSSIEMLRKELGKDAKPYEEMNEADAQTLQQLTSYRETLLKAGSRWTQVMEDQFQWEMAYERQARLKNGTYTYSSTKLEGADKKILEKDANPEAYFYITKPIHSGVQVKGDTAIMSLDKTSSAPIYYRMAEGRHMLDLYLAMQEKGIHYLRVESAHKVGIQNESNIPLYTEDGSINKEGINNAVIESVDFKHYGIQVDTSSKKESQTEGSQLRKQAVGDLMSDGVPIGYKEDVNSWNALTEEEKEHISPIYTLIKKHDEVLSALSNKRYANLLNKLGVTETEEGFDYKDVKKVSDFILNEVTRRELPNNLRDAIEVDPENPRQFKLPLESLTNYQQVRNILWSTIEKNIIRPKVSGGMKTQLAATAWEKGNRIVKTNINGKQVLTSSELKFYGKDENGNTTKCEVYLPFWFGKKVRTTLGKNNITFASDKEFTDHVLNYLNNTTEGKKLLSGIGFRIPTQRDNSIETFIVKDFLPEQMGDTIVLPSEITAKAGSDFDIDKLNTYLRNFFINKKGYPQAVQFENIDSNNIQQLKDYYEYNILEKRRSYEQWERELGANSFLNKLFKVGTEDEEPEYVPTLEEYIEQSKGKTAYELNSLEAIENRYFDTLEDIYSLPQKFKGLISPNDASDLKKISEKISKLKDPNYGEGKQPYGRVLDSLWMMKERHKYLVGKKGVGISAVSQTNLNVNQNAQVYLKLPLKTIIRLPHNTVKVGDKEYTSLSAIKNKSGEDISKVNASFIDGYVDIAKGAWIIDMGATDELAKNFLLMTKWGSDPYDVALFMNQPSVQMYTNEQSSRKSVSQINKDVKTLNSLQLYNYVNAQLKSGSSKETLRKSKPAQYSRASMEQMIEKYGKGEILTKDELKLQMQILDDYQQYDKFAWDMFRFFQGYNWDTSRVNDPNMTRKKLIQYESARKGPISSVDKVMKTSFIGTVMKNIVNVDHALRSLLSIQTGEAGATLDAISQDLSERRGVSLEQYRKSMLKAELSILDYTIQTTTVVSGKTLNKWIPTVLLSNNPSARYLKAIQDSGDEKLLRNPIIQNLRANIDKREGYPSNIELIEKDNDSYTSNVWTDAFRELADDQTVISVDNNRANDLSVSRIFKGIVLSSILQSGSKRSSTSFTHLLPNEYYTSIIKDSVRDIKADLDNFYDNNIFYRTNWEDNVIVPTVPPFVVDDFSDGQLISRKTYYTFNSNVFNEIIKGQNIENPPKVLRLDAFTWGDKKVIKTIEYVKDARTNQVIDRTVRIFQRVDTWEQNKGATPLIASRKETLEGDYQESNVAYAVFKEINKWGDGAKVQEYYNDGVKSVLPSNSFVNEVSDDLISYAIMNSGYTLNTDEYLLSEAVERYENDVTSQGSSDADTESEPSENDKLNYYNSLEDEIKKKLDESDNGCK